MSLRRRIVAAAATLSGTQWVLRAVVLAGVLTAVTGTALQRGQSIGGLQLVTALVGLVVVVWPHVIVAPLFHLLVMFGWLVLPDDGVTASVLPVAAALVVVQLGCAAAVSAPPHLPIPPAVLRPYALAALLFVALAAVVLVGLWLIRRTGLPGHLALMIMAVLGVAGLGLAVLRQLLSRPR